MKNKSTSGLTLLEILIMVAVLGVVAAITIPKFRLMTYQSRESRTKSRLGEIRGALAIYYSDNFGLYPSDEGSPETRLTATLVPQYLKQIPFVDLPHLHSKRLNTVQDRIDDSGDWTYSTLNGFAAVNCTHADTHGEPVSSW
jgi:type II secretory pathway pseudopilin PulG